MNCPKCSSSNFCKDGIVKGRQRHLFKECGLIGFTVERKSAVKLIETKRLALEMYLEGLGFRAIGRILKISYWNSLSMVKRMGKCEVSLRQSDPIAVVRTRRTVIVPIVAG